MANGPVHSASSPQPPQTARLFFALWPDETVRRALYRAGRQLHESCGGRLTKLETIHLTLLFLGDVAVSRLDALKKLADTVSVQPFAMPITRLGWWKHNRVAWAAPEITPEALAGLVHNLETACRVADFKFDARPYVPHITLARKAQCKSLPEMAEPIVWNANEFVLVRSMSDASGAAYQEIGRWPLA